MNSFQKSHKTHARVLQRKASLLLISIIGQGFKSNIEMLRPREQNVPQMTMTLKRADCDSKFYPSSVSLR